MCWQLLGLLQGLVMVVVGVALVLLLGIIRLWCRLLASVWVLKLQHRALLSRLLLLLARLQVQQQQLRMARQQAKSSVAAGGSHSSSCQHVE